jgi:hypothetical protein
LFSPPTPFPQDYGYRSNRESLNDSDNSFTVGTFLLLEHKENYQDPKKSKSKARCNARQAQRRIEEELQRLLREIE